MVRRDLEDTAAGQVLPVRKELLVLVVTTDDQGNQSSLVSRDIVDQRDKLAQLAQLEQ